MINITKDELNKAKAELRTEIEECADCKIEKNLGFKRCDYHEHVIKFLMDCVFIQEECGRCHKETYVAESEGILSNGDHYPIGECTNCGYQSPSWFKEE